LSILRRIGRCDQMQKLDVEREGPGRAVGLRIAVPAGQPYYSAVGRILPGAPGLRKHDCILEPRTALAVDPQPSEALVVASNPDRVEVGDVDCRLDRGVHRQATAWIIGSAPMGVRGGGIDS